MKRILTILALILSLVIMLTACAAPPTTNDGTEHELFQEIISGEYEEITLPEGAPTTVSSIFEAKENANLKGYLVNLVVKGYADNISLTVGIDADGRLVKAVLTEEKETHGKADAIEGYLDSLVGLTEDSISSVEFATGATITSYSIKNAVSDALRTISDIIGNTPEPLPDPDDPLEDPDSPTDIPDNPTEAPEDPSETPEDPSETPEDPGETPEDPSETPEDSFDLSKVPAWNGTTPYIAVHGDVPYFTADEIVTNSYEFYSELDSLGRCGYTIACLGLDLMPTENRGSISSVIPSGWIQRTYTASIVDGGFLYHRSHLIGWQLTGENANECNLITGTEYMNTEGMLPFENMVADYIKETGNHVMYRSTPIFAENNLVASGVLLEAYSVEDAGEGIEFCVFIYNVQPNIIIDYSTGESEISPDYIPEEEPIPENATYVLNTNTKKIHVIGCSSADKISDENKLYTTKTLEELIAEGYDPCKNCDP